MSRGQRQQARLVLLRLLLKSLKGGGRLRQSLDRRQWRSGLRVAVVASAQRLQRQQRREQQKQRSHSHRGSSWAIGTTMLNLHLHRACSSSSSSRKWRSR